MNAWQVTEKPLVPIVATEYSNLPLSSADRYQTFSKYPYIVRDIALWVPAGVGALAVTSTIGQETKGLPIAIKFYIFDEFQKEGRTSLAFRLIFQSFDRTLTEIEVNKIMEKVSAALKAKGFEIR